MQLSFRQRQPQFSHMSGIAAVSVHAQMKADNLEEETLHDASSSPFSSLSVYCYDANSCIQPLGASSLDDWQDKMELQQNLSRALHNQVMRLRKEDRELAEDLIGAPKERFIMNHFSSSHANDMLTSSPRAFNRSPLGMRAKSWPQDAWAFPPFSQARDEGFSS